MPPTGFFIYSPPLSGLCRSRFPTNNPGDASLECRCHRLLHIYMYMPCQDIKLWSCSASPRPGLARSLRWYRLRHDQDLDQCQSFSALVYIAPLYNCTCFTKSKYSAIHASHWYRVTSSTFHFPQSRYLVMAPTIPSSAHGGMFHTFQGVTPKKPASEHQESSKSSNTGAAKRITTPHACAECKRRKM